MSAGALRRWGAGIMVAVAACGGPRGIDVRDLRAFEALKGGTGALYATLVNPTDSSERLDSITSPTVPHISAHDSREENGLVVMAPMTDLTVGAHDSLAFVPGGAHLMLEDLPGDLKVGDSLTVTFWFHRAGPAKRVAHVRRYGS